MPDDAALQLKSSQQSRIRAWKALQGLRQVIGLLTDDPLSAPSKPPCFATEGEVLRSTLLKTLAHLRRDLEGVEKAVENVRPFIGARDGRSLNPDVIIQLNRALGKVGEWTGTLALTEQKCR